VSRPLSPVDRILLLGARVDLQPAEATEMAALVAAGLDWDSLLEDGRIFGLLPLLHRHLSGLAMPGPVRKKLALAYQLQSLKSMRLFGVLGRIEAALAQAGLPAKLLKGAQLAPWLYQDIGLRPMGDLDLLIRPGDRAAVTEALAGLGFKAQAEDAAVYNNPVDAELMQRLHHPPPLFLEPICRVELHLNLLLEDYPGPDPILEEIWAFPGPHLPLEIHFLFLACHLDRHVREDGTGYLYWFCDLHEFLGRTGGELDWTRVTALAKDLGKAPALARALGWLREGWNTALPPGVAAGGGPPLAAILRAGRRSASGSSTRLRLWQKLGLVRHAIGWRARTRYLVGLVLPSPAKVRAMHDPKSPLAWAFWYGAHPFWQCGRVLRSLAADARRRLVP